MKKYLKIIFCLGCGLILMLGSMDAGAYTLSPTWNNTGMYAQAFLGPKAGTTTEYTNWHAHMENVDGSNSASSDWSISLLPITETWGPDGKTTTMGQRIDTELSANLVSTTATLGYSGFIHNGFAISADSLPPLTTPLVDITVTWGGEVKPSWASAQIALKEIHDGGTFVNIIPNTNVNFSSPGNQQTFQVVLPEMGPDYFLTLSLWDQVTWSTLGEHETGMWITMTMSVTEPMDPPFATPLPGTLALLGSGLTALMASVRWGKKYM